MRFSFLLRTICILKLLFVLGCATKNVTLETDVEATVSLVEWGKLADQGEVLGKTPVTIDMGSLSGRVVKIQADGKIPYYWIYADVTGDAVKASLKLRDVPVKQQVSSGLADFNKVQRLIIKAYKALSARDFDLAMNLAHQASEIVPSLAIPLVIKGMAQLELGKNDQARLSLSSAKALDPGDSEIDKLLQLAQ